MAEFVDRNRQSLSMLSAVLLSLVPWMQVSRSRPLLLTVKPAVFATAVGMATLLHFLLLAFNIISVKSLSVVSGGDKSIFSKNENARAVIIVSSQKTLPVLVAVVEQLHGALGEPGLLVLPCVAAHIIQIIIDSFIVNLWLRKDQMSAATKEF
ncbi:probable sodium/metabolite cotransporter BASS4, chloroplastic isoform X1 [Zingiber officinale]|uniref:probable sodium/metabolite cotransporter BASS4, chloroplastic isoform X1 n=2 Tax=Zingiber officinale TaxID=94328 RepID=UPI001C4D7AC5|nr:probable sodium/metabolite cotransporter BASS4, chloroplastic isoform X1 [Zingiber officinale]